MSDTTVVRPVDPELQSALRLAALFAIVAAVFHIAANLYQAHLGYGYFRDELYYLLCGRHLAWGYVDQGPVVALQARLSETVFGRSLAGLRLLSGLAGAARIFLTGLLAWSLGGHRPAQALAMLGVLVTPQYLGTDGYLSMNSFESLFWMICLLALILILRSGSSRLWLLFGLSAGIGLLNKPSMTFFLVALLLALLVSRQRRLLRTPWAALGIALLLIIVLPNILWQIHNHWPTLEFLEDGRKQHKNVALPPLAFVLDQIRELHPLNLLIWGAGLVWLLRRKPYRWLGLTYLFFLAIMMALHAKNYYVSPIYPILFAAGGLAWEQFRSSSLAVRENRVFAFPVLQSFLILTGLILLPMSTPLLTPPAWIAYTRALHLYGKSSQTENQAIGLLPPFFADRFGWQEEADQIARVYATLSPEDRGKVAIWCSNYGEASAVDFLRPGLPVISSHNNFFLWGSRNATGEVMILVNDASPAEMREVYQQVEIVGRMDNPWSMPYEHRNIYLARGRKKNLTQDWPEFKAYI